MKVSIISLGCKVNLYESESISKKLIENGFDVEFGHCVADIYVLTTCAVTNEAERKSRGQIAKILKLNPNAKIYVCGCSSQNNPTAFARYENVVAVYGTGRKMDIADLIIDDYSGEKLICQTIAKTYEDKYSPKPSRTRAYLKIQEGCNNYCSYCIIPYLRGQSRSRALLSIKTEIEMLEKITKEIVLTGIDLSAYGRDLTPQLSLIDVANLFKDSPVRFRFSSLEVGIIDDEFLRKLSQLSNFCEHFHLSMQSGCDTTLKNMNRHYTSATFLAKCQLIRKYFPNCAITTDVIVGFPTETDADFEETYKTCKRAKFSDMHIFPYSPRRNTIALNFKNVVTNLPERIKKLTDLKNKMRDNFIFNNLSNHFQVLIEGKHKRANMFEGHTKNYIKCYIKSDEEIQAGTMLKVVLKGYFEDGVLAEIEE